MERRLAAILAADVVGSSRLIEADEPYALDAIRRALQEVLTTTAAGHGGRLVKTMGDGALLEFASPVDAVLCADEVQRTLAYRAGAEPSQRRILLRIGINLGDVVAQPDGDLYGDVVNVAARLERLAQPGGIAISAKVHDELQGKLALAWQDLGEQTLKGIARPVRVWTLDPGFAALSATSLAPSSSPRLLPSDKASIVVLPFKNISGDPEQEYFSEGMAEEITTALHRAKSLFVVSRASAFAYKDCGMDVREIGRELGVRYVLQGSIRKAGNRVRIVGQLIEAGTGRQIWADRHEGLFEDIFDLQDGITEQVVGALEPTIRMAEAERARAKPTESLDAYNLYLRALPLHYSNDRERLAEAQRLLSRAIAIDPGYSLAKAFSALTTVIQTNQGWTDAADRSEAVHLARESVADPRDDAVILRCAGHALSYLAHEHDTATALLDRALSLHPNSAEVHHSAGWVWNFACDGSRALDHFARAIRLSPIDPEVGHTLIGVTFAQLLMGQYQAALQTSKRAQAAMPTSTSPFRAAIIALVALGDLDEAKRMGRSLLKLNPDFRIRSFLAVQPFKHGDFFERYGAALRAADLPD